MRFDAAEWAAYNASRAVREPRPLCARVLELAGPGEGRQAIDVGAGSGVESGAMLRAGWRVLALDGDASTAERIRAHGASVPGLLEVRTASFADPGPLPPSDLVYAGYSLPYAGEAFDSLWGALRGVLRPGGWWACQLFGDRDSQRLEGNGERFVTRDEALALLGGLELVEFDEEDAPGESFGGPKHWHVFHVVARRPG